MWSELITYCGSKNDMSDSTHSVRTGLNRLALALLRGAKRVVLAIWPSLSRAGSAIGNVVIHLLVLPVYRLAMNIKLRSRRLMIPARGIIVMLFTNRYLMHITVLGIAVATIAMNVVVRQANAQSVGQGSLLYAMVTGSDERLTEQEVNPHTIVKDSHYTGSATLAALPDIDFDYDEGNEPQITAIAVPGTIVAEPVTETSNGPSTATPEPRTKTESYTVQTGDTLSTIAQRFGVNVGTILWANSRTEFQYLRPGDVLKIPAVSGVLVTVKKGDTLTALAAKYSSTVDEIVRANRLSPDQPVPEGLEIVLPGGQPPAVALTYAPKNAVPSRTTPTNQKPSGYYIGKDGIPRNPDVPPPVNYPKPADEAVGSLPTAKMAWPTSGHVVTQYYGWKHTGVDIDGDYSSPIYAAHDGTVTTAGWNSGGYGLQILVTGDGVLTRYGHTSKMFVKVGDVVKKGQVIAMMGTTGRSTGTHLHFEVYINGKRTNPLSYIR
jgi:murein DD-endopeptidase MepM/ murein hydrolase activator NlpD